MICKRALKIRNCVWHHPGDGHTQLIKKYPKTHLEPPIIEILPTSKLLSSTSIQDFLLRYTTLKYVIWLKNGRLSKFDKNIGI